MFILNMNLLIKKFCKFDVGGSPFRWILNNDLTPAPSVTYIWDDSATWDDDNIWKD